MLKAFLFVWALLCAGGEINAAETVTLDGITVAVWRPAVAPSPLLVFSHGFHGRNTQSSFLMVALANTGYLVVAPLHADASCGGTQPDLETPFQNPEMWTDATYQARKNDVDRVLAALETHQDFDWNRAQVGLVGHSLGGYTVLGLGGAWPSWKLPNIKAVLALSPYCEPFVLNGVLANIGRPVMYQGGTRDLGITPTVKRAGGCYDQTSAPAIFVEFQGAGHFAWTDLQTATHALVIRYSLAFLDKYVRGLTPNLGRVRGVSDLRVKEG